MGFALSQLDVAIILVAVLGVLAVGLWASQSVQSTTKSYFLASGRMPWWLIGAAFVSTSVSSEQIVGTVGAAYEHGMGVANWEWFTLPTYTLVILLFIPLYLKNRIVTVPELLTRRFGPLCGDIYSWVMLLAYVFVFMAPVLYGGSLALHRITGWDQHAVLWSIALVVGLYTVRGGLGSIMWADALQCLMLVGGGLVLFFVALDKIPGGWAAMEAANPERFHLYRPADDPLTPFAGILCGAIGVALFYQSTNQVMIQRVLAARSTWDGIMGIVFAGFINLLRPLVTCFLGFVVYHWIHEMGRAEPIENLDHAFPFALRYFSPTWGLRGIVLAGFLAAVMSTISALANATATIFSLDIYRRFICPRADERRTILVGRCAAAVSLVLACLLAPLVADLGGIFRFFQTGVTYTATPFISVILLGLMWKRTSYAGALFGLIGGLVIIVALAVGLPFFGLNWHWLYVAFLGQVLTMIGVVAVSLKTTPPSRQQWEPFYWRPSVFSQYAENLKRPWYESPKLWFAVFAGIWFFLYWRFW